MGDKTSDLPEAESSEGSWRERHLLGTISRHSLVGIAVLEGGRITYANDALLKIVGISREEVYAMEPDVFPKLLHPDDRKTVLSYYAKRMAQAPGVPEQYNVRILARDGTVKWASSRAERVEFDGRPMLIVSLVDITEWKQTEEALRTSEARYRNLFDLAPIGIAIVSIDETVIAVNDAVMQMISWPRKRLLGMNLADLEAMLPGVMGPVRQAFARVRNGEKVEAIQVELSARPERSAWLEILVSLPEEEGTSRFFHVIIRDVTAVKSAEQEKRALEMQLRHQQKLEAIGTLAAGLAHEINNPIAGILNFAQIIARRSDEKDAAREFADGIIAESWRVSEIVRSLLAFSRQEKAARVTSRLNDLVDATLRLTGTLLKKDRIDLQVDIPEDLPPVRCSSQQIQQVLMNVLTNARDAVIERYPEPDERAAIAVVGRIVEKQGATWTRITVTDGGIGIRSEIADRIFEPFFTTKPFNTGTGLGLSVSYGIVREHGGALWFESDEENGTRFHLDLPADASDS